MLGKLIDGRLVVAGKEVCEGKAKITNPTEEKLKELGYKEIEYTEKPSYDDEEETLTEKYTEEETKIIVGYDIEVLNDYAHNEVIKRKIVEEENKITARNIRGALLDINFDKNKIVEIENNIAELRAKLREITNEE